MENLLQNKYVLYLVLFIAVTNVLGYLAIEDFNSLMVFIAICALASHFSKNMIVILGSAILGTNILYANSRMREGMKNKKKKKTIIEDASNNTTTTTDTVNIACFTFKYPASSSSSCLQN